MLSMKPTQTWLTALALAFVSVSHGTSARADLPELNEKPWLAHFAGFESRRFNFGYTSKGKGLLIPIGKSGSPVGHTLHLPIQIVVEETLPSGTVTAKQIKPETLETKDAASDKFEKLSFTGKVTGDASFEAHLEVNRGVVSIGGRMLDPGTLTKNPVRFCIRVGVPSLYRYDSKDTKAFRDKVSRDELRLVWTDGKRLRVPGDEEVDARSPEVNGSGIADLELNAAAYQGKKISLAATAGSSMALWHRHAQPLYEGFSINWYPDPEKDPEGKSRLSFEVK